ncbi:MAG: glutathione S-transferase N-terminal domain-containing protein [Coriobacteriales bacterium]|jgi:glutaredoxin|nr:glutathione S-transferase N-terminal domain-containing protein [Coriobacteriales bacterium]
MDELKLYYLPTCPFSLKVLRFLESNSIVLDLHSTTEPANKEYLLKHGGKNQVPCLFIGDRPLYESDDIIDYLSEKYLN